MISRYLASCKWRLLRYTLLFIQYFNFWLSYDYFYISSKIDSIIAGECAYLTISRKCSEVGVRLPCSFARVHFRVPRGGVISTTKQRRWRLEREASPAASRRPWTEISRSQRAAAPCHTVQLDLGVLSCLWVIGITFGLQLQKGLTFLFIINQRKLQHGLNGWSGECYSDHLGT